MNSRTLLAPSFLVLALVAGCNRQEADWEEAREADTVAAYQEFLEEHPESQQAQVAQQRMRALQRAERWRPWRSYAAEHLRGLRDPSLRSG